MKRLISLEPEAEQVCQENSQPPLIFQIPPEEGRERLEKAQDSPVYKYPAQIKKLSAITNGWGCVTVYFVIPDHLCDMPGVI